MAVGSKTSGMITRAKYARRVGISRSAVTRLVQRGQIPVHGPKKLIDPAEADQARDAARVRFNITDDASDLESSGLAHRKAETETYRARLAKLAYERAVKRLLPKRSVELALAEASRVIVQQLNGLVAEAEIQAVLRWARGERRQPGTDNPRTVWLTPEEAERLIQCAGPALDKIAFLLGSGCRSGEMFALDVKNWNSATRQAFIEDTKNGYPRWVRLPGRSVDLMGDLPDVGRMFKTPKGLAYKLRRHGGGQMQAAFNKARDAAGLGPEITPHVLRHTWATWYYAQTKDFGGLMDLGGWRKSDMANRYRKLAPDDLTARMLDFGWDFRQESGNLQRAGSLSLVSK